MDYDYTDILHMIYFSDPRPFVIGESGWYLAEWRFNVR